MAEYQDFPAAMDHWLKRTSHDLVRVIDVLQKVCAEAVAREEAILTELRANGDRYPEAIQSFCRLLQLRCNAKAYHDPWETMTDEEVEDKRKEEELEVYRALHEGTDEDVRDEELDRTLVAVIDLYRRGVL